MGLENSKVFTLLMITGVLSISGLIAVITHIRGNMEAWHHDEKIPKGVTGVRLFLFLIKNLFLFFPSLTHII